jgi:hypothetical protein
MSSIHDKWPVRAAGMYGESNGAATLRRAYLRLALGVAQMVMPS